MAQSSPWQGERESDRKPSGDTLVRVSALTLRFERHKWTAQTADLNLLPAISHS